MASASRDIIVSNSMGLHARPAMAFVDLANQFTSEIKVTRTSEGGITADGKSIMEMIMLEAAKDTPLKIEANGDDADQAVKKLAELFESKFGEE
jgi:phosphocarrier protein